MRVGASAIRPPAARRRAQRASFEFDREPPGNHNARMLLVLNAALYLVALTLSLCVVTPVPAGASRKVRVARMALALGGGGAITAAITLTFVGMWVESAIVGLGALVVVCVCLWVALSHS